MSKVEQRPVIGIVPTQVPDEDIVRVNDHYTKAVIASGAAPLVLPIAFNALLTLLVQRLPRGGAFLFFSEKKLANLIDKTYKHSRINAIT